MKAFLKVTILFVVGLFASMAGLIEVAEYSVENNADFEVKSKPKYAVFGHSVAECAYNDTVITDFVNLCKSGESYFYSYVKVKKIVEQNPNLEVVFVEFTNNSIRKPMDIWIWGDKDLNFRYPMYSPFMDFEDKFMLAKNNITGFYNANSLTLKHNLGITIKKDYEYVSKIGAYQYLGNIVTDSTLNAAKPLKKKKNSDANLLYLRKIIDVCEANGKRVVLLRTPTHKNYSGMDNEEKYQGIRNDLFSSVDYLDLARFSAPDHQFADLKHLNYEGATRFSKWFDSVLKKGLLDQADMQSFVDSEIDSLAVY